MVRGARASLPETIVQHLVFRQGMVHCSELASFDVICISGPMGTVLDICTSDCLCY